MAVQRDIANGKAYTDTQLYNMAGRGQGKMLPQQVDEALKSSHAVDKDPDMRIGVNLIANTFPLPQLAKDATPEQVSAHADAYARQSKTQALVYQAWQKRIEEHPTEDKLAALKAVTQPAVQEDIANKVNAIFGVPPAPRSIFSLLPKVMWSESQTFDDEYQELQEEKAKQAAPAVPDAGATIRVREKSTGRTGTIPAKDYDEKTYEKVQ
jgi:hypothetical protein